MDWGGIATRSIDLPEEDLAAIHRAEAAAGLATTTAPAAAGGESTGASGDPAAAAVASSDSTEEGLSAASMDQLDVSALQAGNDQPGPLQEIQQEEGEEEQGWALGSRSMDIEFELPSPVFEKPEEAESEATEGAAPGQASSGGVVDGGEFVKQREAGEQLAEGVMKQPTGDDESPEVAEAAAGAGWGREPETDAQQRQGAELLEQLDVLDVEAPAVSPGSPEESLESLEGCPEVVAVWGEDVREVGLEEKLGESGMHGAVTDVVPGTEGPVDPMKTKVGEVPGVKAAAECLPSPLKDMTLAALDSGACDGVGEDGVAREGGKGGGVQWGEGAGTEREGDVLTAGGGAGKVEEAGVPAVGGEGVGAGGDEGGEAWGEGAGTEREGDLLARPGGAKEVEWGEGGGTEREGDALTAEGEAGEVEKAGVPAVGGEGVGAGGAEGGEAWGEGAGTEREGDLLARPGGSGEVESGEGGGNEKAVAMGGPAAASDGVGGVTSAEQRPVVTYRVKEVMPGEGGGGTSSEEEAAGGGEGECMSSTCEMTEEWWMEGEEVECVGGDCEAIRAVLDDPLGGLAAAAAEREEAAAAAAAAAAASGRNAGAAKPYAHDAGGWGGSSRGFDDGCSGDDEREAWNGDYDDADDHGGGRDQSDEEGSGIAIGAEERYIYGIPEEERGLVDTEGPSAMMGSSPRLGLRADADMGPLAAVAAAAAIAAAVSVASGDYEDFVHGDDSGREH